jgi:soluble lytic murein transglycosylase
MPTALRGDVARASDADLDAILELVAQYRRTADDSWRRKLAVAVHREAAAAGLDPLLVAAIVATESSFQSRAVSSAGAVGLMQLRPFVARAVAARHSVDWHGPDALHDPHINVRLGVRYYSELLARFDGDEVKALTAYNYGPTRVRRQLLSSTYRGSRYADDVLGLYARLAQNRMAPLRASPIDSRATS